MIFLFVIEALERTKTPNYFFLEIHAKLSFKPNKNNHCKFDIKNDIIKHQKLLIYE
jgi:hypothetical protein